MKPGQRLYFLIQQRRQRTRHAARRPARRIEQGGVGLVLAFSLLLVAGLLGLGVTYASLTSDLPAIDQLPRLLNPASGSLLQPTRLYDRTGKNLLVSLENPAAPRRFLALNPGQPNSLSPHLVQVTVGLLQPAFWAEPGFNYAALADPKPGTLAERLANRLLLYQEPPGLRHTIYMRFLAAQMTARFGRARILEWYLNSSDYGHRAFGAESAAQLYLGKSASQLNLAEAALLAALAETPALNPFDSPSAARDRQGEVLTHLLAHHLISQADYDEARAFVLDFKPAPEQNEQETAFTRLALAQLSLVMDPARLEMGGLRIITTLDSDLQKQVECTARTQLLRLEEASASSTLSGSQECLAANLLPTMPPTPTRLPPDLLASAIILDPTSGQILALLEKSSLAGEQHSTMTYQPGSVLTPLAALTGFTRGFSPASLVWDLPNDLPPELKNRQNPDGKFHGPLRLRNALANDIVLPMAKLLTQFSPAEVWRLAEPLGLDELKNTLHPASLLFEGGDVSLTGIAQAYGVLAAGGEQYGLPTSASRAYRPLVVLAVEDLDGRKVLETGQTKKQAVLSLQLTYLVHSILSDEIARRPSLGYPNALDIGRPAAARVGQTANATQVWSAGYTPQRVVVTWLGLPAQAGTGPDSLKLDVRWSAGLWHALTKYAVRDLPPDDWAMPPGIVQRDVCDPSGQIPTRDCPNVVREVFIEGSEPTTYDTLYRVFHINRETGLLATVFTPLELVEQKTFMVLPPEGRDWAAQAGLSLPPSDYDLIQPPPASPTAQITNPPLFSYTRGTITVSGSAAGEGFVSFGLQAGQGLFPLNWQQIGEERSTPVSNGTLATWDTTTLEDGLYALRLTVQHQGQNIETAVTQVTVDNTRPTLQIPYPAAGQEFSLQDAAEIQLRASVHDTVGVKRVEWLMDGQRAGERQQEPYVLPWKLSPGTHKLLVRAYDLAGNVSESPEINFMVR